MVQSHPQPNLRVEKGANNDFLPFADDRGWARLQRVVTSWLVESGAMRSSPSSAIDYPV